MTFARGSHVVAQSVNPELGGEESEFSTAILMEIAPCATQPRAARVQHTQAQAASFFFLVKPSSYSRTTYTDGRGDDGENTKAEARGKGRSRAPRASNTRGHRLRRRAQKPSLSDAPEGGLGRAGIRGRLPVAGWPPLLRGCIWTRRCARHRGHLVFASCCMSASQPRQTACGQCQRYGGARERASRAGHGELNVSMHTEQSSPVHSGSGGAAGTHPRGRPPGRGIEPKAASAVARSPKAWRRCSSNPATHTCPR